jgi:polysaccharide biosynthesis protein PslF
MSPETTRVASRARPNGAPGGLGSLHDRQPPSPPPSVGFVGTYPTTRCGIATFTAELRRAIGLPRSGVIASVDASPHTRFGPEVLATLVRGSRPSLAAAAATLSTFDLAIVQHEFGIYGGEDGAEIVELLAGIDIPAIVVLHTVLRAPSPNQRAILEAVVAAADIVVVQSEAARSRLLEAYEVPPSRVRVVPHGARTDSLSLSPLPGERPIVLTWGLLGDGKGIEFAIEAFALVRDIEPAPRYVIHGRTHPRVAHREGEAYRNSLVRRVEELGLQHVVEFDDRYLDTRAVLEWIRRAYTVLLPYRSREQVVSGVLVEALASGTPVVATRFPHAEELLSEGSGILVPHDDPDAIAAALRLLLGNAALRERMAEAARRQAPLLSWEHVGRAYRGLATAAVSHRRRGTC